MQCREQRSAAVLRREGGQRHLASKESHLFQPVGPPPLQELRAARGKAQLCHRRDGRLRPGVSRSKSLWLFGTLEPIKLFNCTNGLDFKFVQILGTFYGDSFFFMFSREIRRRSVECFPDACFRSSEEFTSWMIGSPVNRWRYQSLDGDINHLLEISITCWRYQSIVGNINHLLELSITSWRYKSHLRLNADSTWL